MVTIGRTTNTGSWWNNTYLWACKFNAGSSGTLTNICFYGYMGTYGTDYLLGIWEDNAGAPGALLVSSAELQGPGGGWQWHPNEPGTAINESIVSGNDYWLGGWCETGTQFKVYEAGSSNQTAYRDISYNGSLPDPFGTPDGYEDYNLAVYATYTPSASGASIPVVMHHRKMQGISAVSCNSRFPKFTLRTVI